MASTLFTLCLTLVALLSFPSTSLAEDPCYLCHEEKTPGINSHWKNSAHAKAQVTCISCHGSDVNANHERTVTVTASVCGSCHQRAYADHTLSRHNISLKSGRGCTRNLQASAERQKSCVLCHDPDSGQPRTTTECAMFLAQSPEMQRQGCDSCHKVETRCDACHTRHGTDIKTAALPETCGTCHMGPDHAQYEMWESSPHGVLFRRAGEKSGPSCVSCHMKNGSHNVSRGIASNLPDSSQLMKEQERSFMIEICAACHTRSMTKRSLEDADHIQSQSRALLSEAQGIVEKLQEDRLLLPSPEERPAHPLFGNKFVIGPHMLYENLSRVESLFFRMKQFHYMNTIKGAFHQNPDYTHWYGNAPMKLTLSEIKSEDALLRKMDILRKRLDNLSHTRLINKGETGELKIKLRELNERKLRGELSERDHQGLKDQLLKEKGL